MIDPENPYAPPKADLKPNTTDLGDGAWRSGKLVVLARGFDLPCRCIRCNEPAVTPVKPRKIYWHPPGWYLLILLNLLIYLIVALIVRKRATISPGLCARHLQRRNRFIAASWLIVLAAAMMITIAFNDRAPLLFPAGLILLLISVVVGLSGGRLLLPTSIDPQFIRLRGAGRPFLDSLPGL